MLSCWPAFGLTTFNVSNCGTGPAQATTLQRQGSQGWQGMTGGSSVANDCVPHQVSQLDTFGEVFRVAYTVVGSSVTFYSEQKTVPSATTTVNFTVFGGNAPTLLTTNNVVIQNYSPNPEWYQRYDNGIPVGSPFLLQPGESRTFQVVTTGAQSVNYNVQFQTVSVTPMTNPDGTGVGTGPGGTTVFTNVYTPLTNFTLSPTPGGQITYTVATNSYDYRTPFYFNSTNILYSTPGYTPGAAVSQQTMAQGFSAVISAIVSGTGSGSQDSAREQILLGKIADYTKATSESMIDLRNSLTNGNGGSGTYLTNLNSVSLTNNLSITNIVQFTNAPSDIVSNLFEFSRLMATNKTKPTALAALSGAGVPDLETPSTVKGIAESRIAESVATLDSASGMLTVPAAASGSAGSIFNVSFSVGGHSYNMNMNPMSNASVAALASLVHSLVTWIVYATYALSVLAMISEHVRSFTAAQQADMPDIEVQGFTFGGNLGIFLFVAIIALVAFALQLLVGAMATWLSSNSGMFAVLSTNPFSGANDTAVSASIWLAAQFVPLNLIVTTVVSYLLFRLSITKVYLLATFIIRMIPA